MRPFFYLAILVLLLVVSCEKGACPPASPHNNENDTVYLAGHDTILHDTIIVYNGDSGNCHLKVPNNENTYQNSLSFSTYLQTPKENANPQTPNVRWFTKTNSSNQYCDSVAFVLNADTNATSVFPAVSITCPESFTPNGDGINDNLVITVDGIYLSFSVKIFNRFGVIVFESNTPDKSWDAKYNGELQSDIHICLIEAEFFAKNDFVLYKTTINTKVIIIN